MLAMAIACALGLTSAEAAFGPLGQQQRISFMGPNGLTNYFATSPSVAYNPSANEYLVVWFGDDSTPPLVDNEFEIFGQRLSSSGAPLGERIRVSAQGMDGDPGSEARYPSVAYNAAANEYVVVWEGEVGTSSEFEIWGRRLSATGARLGGSDDLRISHMGPDGDPIYTVFDPRVAANPVTGEYVVVWAGDDNTMPLVNNEYEIFGQRLTSLGQETGRDDFRISEQGADGNTFSEAFAPDVGYDSSTGQYLVVWQGDMGTGANDEYEIWAQRLNGAGDEVGGSDFQISDLGPDGNGNYDAFTPKLVSNPTTGDYLVVWLGDDDTAPLVDNEYEVFGQRLTSAGAATGANDFRISEQGADGNPASEALSPSVAYDTSAGEYLVAWNGEIGTTDSFEIWAQRLTATASEVGGSDFRVSQMGPEGEPEYNADTPTVAANTLTGEFLVAWTGDDDTGQLVNEEFEIFGRRLGIPAPMLTATDPASPANDNHPRLKGSVAPAATVDVFTNPRCLGAPAVNDAPGSALNGSGIAVPVTDNAVTELSATATEGARTSGCSNSIAYAELTPPAPTPPPPPPPPPPPLDTTAPVVSGFAVFPAAFRLAAASTPRGSSFRFRLSERATARIVIERALPGRRVGRRCVPPARRLRARARCLRFKRVGVLTFRNRPAGRNRIAFRGRMGRRALAAGGYRATITASDARGNRSSPRRTRFTVVRR